MDMKHEWNIEILVGVVSSPASYRLRVIAIGCEGFVVNKSVSNNALQPILVLSRLFG